MAATTGQLGLVTPTQGTLTGTWGDTVNNGITEYTNIAIAGTLTLTGDGAVTLANTTGDASASNVTSTLTGAGTVTAQFAIVRVTGTLTVAKVVTAPSYSKTYTVVNAATGGIVTFKASGQTGVSVAVGETAFVYFNGTDYVKVVGTATAGAAGGSTTQVQYNNAGVLAGITGATSNGTALTLVAPNLGSPASVGTMPAFTLGGTVSGGGNQINNVIIGTTTPLAGAFTTVDASGAVTLSGGTANGVTYLNGSKVLTSGSALTFDGTNIATTGAITSTLATTGAITATGSNNDAISAYIENSNQTGAGAADRRLVLSAAGNTSYSGVAIWQNRAVIEGTSPGGMAIGANTANAPLVFYAGARTEGMRLTSTGLGIGTSSPQLKFVVSNAGAQGFEVNPNSGIISGGIDILCYNRSAGAYKPIYTNAEYHVWATSTTERMRLDSSGNLGLGLTPKTYSLGKALEVGFAGNGINGASQTQVSLVGNAYYNGNWKYGGTGKAAFMQIDNGTILWYNTDTSGTADNNITGFSERARIDTSGNFMVGTASSISSASRNTLSVFTSGASTGGQIIVGYNSTTRSAQILGDSAAAYFGSVGNIPVIFRVNEAEVFRMDTSNNLLVGVTSASGGGERLNLTKAGGQLLYANRTSDDGTLVSFAQDGTTEGNITVTGTTVSYNGGHLSRYAQTTAPKDESIVKGTVMSNLDEMNVYTKDGQPVDNEQLNKVKVSDTEGDANVAGVCVGWSHDEDHNVDEINMAMTGDMIIRIAQGVTVIRGDLLMSAGDGTAKPQGDDIVRSKTVAKVTSNHVTCTYTDGSYCVPCVLMAC